MNKKYPTKYCEHCGSKMIVTNNMGDEVYNISAIDEEHYKYNYKMFNRDTGKRKKIYTCPNWKIIKGNWFTPDKLNEHDKYRMI